MLTVENTNDFTVGEHIKHLLDAETISALKDYENNDRTKNNKYIKKYLSALVDEKVDRTTKELHTILIKAIIKHILLLLFISWIISTCFSRISSSKYQLIIFILSFISLLLISFLVIKKLRFSYMAKGDNIFEMKKYENTHDMDRINSAFVNYDKEIDSYTEIMSDKKPPMIMNIIIIYYFGSYERFINMAQKARYSSSVLKILTIHNISIDFITSIENKCIELYKRNEHDYVKYIHSIYENFNNDEFLNTIFNKFTFCPDSYANNYMLIGKCITRILNFNESVIEKYSADDINNAINDHNLDTSPIASIIGQIIVYLIIIEKGFKNIERNDAIIN